MSIKKVFISLLVMIFFTSYTLPAYAYEMMPEYLCELGVYFYQKGRITEALHEFQKALIINPGYEPALDYINMIKQEPSVPMVEKRPILKSPIKTRQQAIEEFMDRAEEGIYPLIGPPIGVPALREEEPRLKEILLLDKNIATLKFPLEIELGKSIVLRGDNIKRFLATEPNVLTIERVNSNEILVTAKDFGYTYLHIWDEQGRWTLEFLTVPPKPKVTTYEELMRKEEERARSFKIRY